MPDHRLPEPTERPTPAPALRVDRQQQPGYEDAGQKTDSMPSTSSTPTIPKEPSPENQHEASPRIPYWLQQAERFLRVVVRMYLGLLVCCAPWYPPAWDSNPLFASSPALLSFVTLGAVRGIVSGLGVLNLWIAVRDALRSTVDPDSGHV